VLLKIFVSKKYGKLFGRFGGVVKLFKPAVKGNTPFG
jgi:hypothetical protein